MSEASIREPAGRVAEAVLIAILSSLFERATEHIKERHAARANQEERIAALEAEIASLKAGKA